MPPFAYRLRHFEEVDEDMLTREELLRHYETMVKIRKFDLEAVRAREAGEVLGFIHPYVGEEAIATGVCAWLETKDKIASTHRGHGHTIAKGGDMNAMMAELYGKVTGTNKGKGGSQHIADFKIGMLGANGIVGGGYALAVGAALAARLQNTGAISVVFFGDGAANRGTFHEAANMAAAWKLPVIFVCENNGIASATTTDEGQQSVQDFVRRAYGYDMAGYTCNGNDFFDVYEMMGKLARRAREGEGNRCGILECKTHRPMCHVACDTQAYRDGKSAWAKFQADDCIANFARRCLAEGWLTQADFDAVQNRVTEMVEAAKQFAIDSPYPPESELTTDLYD